MECEEVDLIHLAGVSEGSNAHSVAIKVSEVLS
jgi:hypothetical protein